MRRTRSLIVGGGPAGAMAAILLARAGEQPLLLEKSRTPRDIVCGGFLGWDTLALLRRQGIDVDALGAHPVAWLHLVAGNRSALIDMPFPAAGLSRRTLDAALLAQAEQDGALVERGVAVREIDTHSRTARTADATIEASSIFIATGKHDLRGTARETIAGDDPPVGLRVRIEGTAGLRRALEHRIELILFDRGYAGLILQEDGAANLCLTVARSRLDEARGDRARLLALLAAEAPILDERLRQGGSVSGWASVARVPYGWRTSVTEPGIFRLGDQAAVIASLAGDGIAIALESACSAARHHQAHGPDGASIFQRDFAMKARRPLWIAERLRSIAENGALAPSGIAILGHVPAAARLVTRMTRISGY